MANRVRAERAENAGSSPTLPGARALQAKPPHSSLVEASAERSFKLLDISIGDALQHGLCVGAGIYSKWGLFSLPHSQQGSTAPPLRPWGPHVPTQPLMSNDYRPDTVLCSGKCKDKLPLLRIPISQKKGTAIQWVPTTGWALGICYFIQS